MKILITTMFLMCSVHAVSITYSDTAEKTIKNIVNNKEELILDVKRYQKENKKSLNDKKKQSSTRAIKNNFASIKMENIDNSMHFEKKKNYKSKGIKRDENRAIPKQIALTFLKDYFPYMVRKDENLKVLAIGEESGATQERDKDGKIKSDVNVKSFSYDIRVGRKILDLPVFDSTSSIQIDPATEKITSFDLFNWSPVTIMDNETLIKKVSNKSIKKIIEDRLVFEQKDEKEIDGFYVDKIMLGWITDIETNELTLAVLYKGELKDKNIKISSNDKALKFSFLDRVDGKKDITIQPVFSSNSIKQVKPIDDKKVDKPIEAQGVKDYEKKISPEKIKMSK